MAEGVEPDDAQQAHARRVAEAKATVPHAYLEAEARPAGEAGPEAVVRAVAAALRDAPRVNGFYRDGRHELRPEVNVAVAVTTRETVLYPVIREPDRKDAAAVRAELEELSNRTRAGSITQPDLSGGTFALADLRPQGASRAYGIVRRGQSAHLNVGRAATDRISLCLAYDARIVDVPQAAEFLVGVRERLERPPRTMA